MSSLNRTLCLIWACASLSLSVCAQTPSQPPKKTPRTNVSTSVDANRTVPQVVTIVHRLNGLKMFRLLLRSQEQVEAIANLDEAFDFTDDVHTNIIAGVALDDGRTIAAWLPDAEVEFGPSFFTPLAPRAPGLPAPRAPNPAFSPSQAKAPRLPFSGGMFGSPDLTVIGPEGQPLEAEYVGLDGATGLSILRLIDGKLTVGNSEAVDAVGEGEDVRVFNPERATSTKPMVAGSLFVRMGTTPGTVLTVKRAPLGPGLARFKVKSPRLSLANIGGVAVNQAGETVGIVDAVNGLEATILPTGLIRRAATRVLARKTSVPRPWLGVKGQPVAGLSVDQIKNLGWDREQATSLVDRHLGIMLTSIAPGSPAAMAALKPGDVVLKVNNEAVSNDDDFSWMLDQAGPNSEVTFTLARPDRMMEVSVELSGLLDPALAFRLPTQPAVNRSLLSHGIETVALKPRVANRLGAASGLLIVYVDPATAAFDAGLQPGDVIESIDGRPIQPNIAFQLVDMFHKEQSRFDIVRKKQKLTITVSATDKKR